MYILYISGPLCKFYQLCLNCRDQPGSDTTVETLVILNPNSLRRLVWYCAEGGCQRAAWVGGHRERCQTQAVQAAVDPVEELLREQAPPDFMCPIRSELKQCILS